MQRARASERVSARATLPPLSLGSLYVTIGRSVVAALRCPHTHILGTRLAGSSTGAKKSVRRRQHIANPIAPAGGPTRPPANQLQK
jgi:hypothetical protein